MTKAAGAARLDPLVDLSVVVVSWNTRDLLARCLESVGGDRGLLLRQDEEAATKDDERLRTEVFVVDNASSDGSAQMVRDRFPWVELIENAENAGFAAANNQAIGCARGRYVVLLNSDAEVRQGALQVLVAFLEAHPRAGACGARLLNSDGSLQPSCYPMLTPGRELWRLMFLDRVWPRATYRMHRWDTDVGREVEVIIGACLLLRQAALKQIGLLDERYFMYTEEVDLCYRLARAGWALWWVPAAEVVHHEAASTRQAAETMYVQLYRSKVQFYRKVGGERQARQFKRLVRLAYGPRLVVTTLAGPLSSGLATQARAFRRLLSELPGM